MKNIFHRTALAALCLAALALPGCEKSQSPQDGAHKSAAAEKAGDRHDHDAAKPGGQGDEHRDGHGEEEQLKLGAEEIAAAGIKTEELAEQEISEQLVLTATIRPNQDRIAHVAPRVPGRIVKAAVNLGDGVRAGQTLAVLDSLEVGEAHSAWLQARTAQALAKADFERAEALHTDQIIARKDHLRSHAEYEKSKAALAAAADRLRMLGVSPSPSSDGKAVSAFPLTTPFAGTVIEKKATVGQLSNPSEPLFTVADLSKVWIEANLNETQLTKVRPGASATVTVTAYPGERFVGRMTYVASVLDKDSRTIPARIEVDNKDGRLKPEMFATATIDTNGTVPTQKGEVLTVPDEAIVLMQGQPTVFVFEHGGFEARAIEPGEKIEGRTIIKSGLASGDQIVAAGTYALKARLLKSQISDEH